MATSVKCSSNESVAMIKNFEKLGVMHGVSSSQLTNNVVIHNSNDEVTKQIVTEDDNVMSDINDSSAIVESRVKENLFAKKLNNEVANKEIKQSIEHNDEKNENLDIKQRVLIDQSKNNNCQTCTESIVSETVMDKRKRKLSTDVNKETSLSDDSNENVKRKKQSSTNDSYCWRCHKDIVDANCNVCPRSWHRKCMGGISPNSTTDNWICGECANILRAENARTRSPTMAHLTVDQLCMVLKYVIDRMRSSPGAEPFWTAVDLKEVPNYLDYVIKPMDLSLLESNVAAKFYGSTDAFMADAKWIQHNCIVFNTCGRVYADTSKLTNAAKQVIKIARQEVSEIEACPDCYARGRNLPRPLSSWFIEACHQPHPLIWAKLKGFPFWPAKALPRTNGQGYVDVRFFGEHDRAWVSPKDIYLYSRDPPTSLPRKKKQDMVECIKEITQHCKKLEISFGPFQFAPPRTQYHPHDPMQIKLMFPEYNPERSYDSTDPFYRDNRIVTPSAKQLSPVKNSSISKNETLNNDNSSTKELASPIAQGNNSDESHNDNKNHLTGPNECQSQKNRLKKLTSAVTTRFQNDSTKSSDSSTAMDITEEQTPTTTPKKKAVRKTVTKKLTASEKCSLVDNKSDAANTQKVTVKNRKNYVRKVTASSTPLLTSDANGKVTKTNIIRIYKPKSRIVDQLNAAADEVKKEKSPVKTPNSGRNLTIHTTAKEDNSMAGTSTSHIFDESVERHSSKLLDSSIDLHNQKINTHNEAESNELISSQQSTPVIKRQSTAKKSFPNKPPRAPIRIQMKSPTDFTYTKDSVLTNSNDSELSYELPPPEAGPLCAQLNRGANELAAKMARFIEETIQEVAQSKIYELSSSGDAHEATVYSLRLQIERMRWQHQQQLAELKNNTDQTLREMRASLEVERLRAIEEIRKEAEEEKLKCVQETKSKQWCSYCGNEALYYCCWNTAYCNHTCQQMHWQTHIRKCTQKATPINSTSNVQEASGTNQSQQQHEIESPETMPRLIINTQHGSSNVRGA